MKKKSFAIILFSAAFLASCRNSGLISSAVDPIAKDVVNALKRQSHTASFVQEVYVNQTDPLSIDGYIKTEATFTYSYDETEGRGFKRAVKQTFADLQKGTHNPVVDEEGNPVLSVYDNAEELYFRDNETGVVLAEYLTAGNTVDTYIQSTYDETYGTYTPVMYDEEFRNPFDFILARDLNRIGDHSFSLNLSKATFALTCYGATAPAAVKSATIIFDDSNKATELDFEMAVEGGEGYTYTRETTFKVLFSSYGDASVLHHIKPFEYSNPELQAALNAISTAESYKYSKDYIAADGSLTDHIQGYFTKDVAFYHHHDTPEDTECYKQGDDYDYMALYNETEKCYIGYDYTYGTPDWKWGAITVSSSALYTIEDFAGLGPRLPEINASLFHLKEGATDVYICDDMVLARSLGQYFDFQFLGVNSQVLETNSVQAELTLSADGSLSIATGYKYTEYGRTVVQKIVYTLDSSSINNTTIPSYVVLP